MKEISKIVLDESGTQALQYSTTEGFNPLREQIAKRMNSKNKTNITMNDILITKWISTRFRFCRKNILR